jgi:hypothetical protein
MAMYKKTVEVTAEAHARYGFPRHAFDEFHKELAKQGIHGARMWLEEHPETVADRIKKFDIFAQV